MMEIDLYRILQFPLISPFISGIPNALALAILSHGHGLIVSRVVKTSKYSIHEKEFNSIAPKRTST
jgi:hypothetical protein